MKPARLRNLPAWAAIGVFVATAGVLLAQMPLSEDAEGNVSFRTPNGTVLKVAANADVSIDGQVLINCRDRPQGQVSTRGGKAECAGAFAEVEDSFGNELEVYPTLAEAEDDDGNDYEIPLSKSPLGGSVRIGSGGVVSGDWRDVGGPYRAADTERLLVELGAVEDGDVIRLALAGDVLFDFGSDAIRADAADKLTQAAQVIRQRSVGEVYVVGHTDSVGGDEANQKLSERRAAAVISWLDRNQGIPAAVLVGRGMGSRKPVAHNTMPDGSDDPAGRARNRRVEILLATREGVDLVDVAGLVQVGPAGVKVGGVEMTAGGVRVGGVTVGTTGTVAGVGGQVVDEEAPASCKTGHVCSFSCPSGNCVMTCEAGATCQMTCSGGNCNMRCNPGANCDLACSGGDCRFACPLGSVCQTSCTGDGCRRS